jgi:hypothetical protein
MSPVMVSVYDEQQQRCIGFILRRRNKEQEAFGRDGKSLGIFATMPLAAEALPPKNETNKNETNSDRT